jgi:RNA polymerase sigma-70 factor (ECF subfamily)
VKQTLPPSSWGGPCELPPGRRDVALLAEHLDSAYNLARYLMRNGTEAEDAVQSAYVRAISHFAGFRGGDGRAWLLTIVRNTCYDRLRKLSATRQDTDFDETVHSGSRQKADPEKALLLEERRELVRKSLAELPAESREVLILRELEQLSYREIADIAGIPVGTVMSRLSRARQRLQHAVSAHLHGGKMDAAPLPGPGTSELPYRTSDDARRSTWSERS